MELVEVLLVLFVAFLAGIEGILDEFEFHQPIIACSLIGLVSGHFEEGLILGGFLQLIALGWANIGAAVAPDACFASVMSSVLMIKALGSGVDTNYIIAACIAIAIPLSLIGLSLTKICRNKAITLVHKMDETANVSKYQILGILMQGVRVLIPVLIAILIPASVYIQLFSLIPTKLYEGLVAGSYMVCVVGFAIVANVLSSKRTWPFLLIGFGLAAITDLPIIILCLIGFGLMWITMQNSTTASTSKTSDDPLGDIIDDYE